MLYRYGLWIEKYWEQTVCLQQTVCLHRRVRLKFCRTLGLGLVASDASHRSRTGLSPLFVAAQAGGAKPIDPKDGLCMLGAFIDGFGLRLRLGVPFTIRGRNKLE